MQFRFAQPDEIPDIAQLVAHSFIGRSLDFWSAQLRDPPQGGGVGALLVGHSDGALVASLQLLPLKQWIGGSALPVAGVGTVTVAPTHRQQGIASALMVQALRAASERGDVASALYAFRYTFYQKLGYGAAGIALQYLVPPDSLPASEARQQVERLEGAQRNEVLELYNRWIRTQNGQLERTARMWEHAYDAPNTALVGYRNADGALEGYALVVYRADLPVTERFLEVNELVWTTAAARSGLFGWLASLSDQWQRILIRALPSHQLGEIIREPVLPRGSAPLWGLYVPSATQLIGPMFRLLDISSAWRQRHVQVSGGMSIGLHVVDGQNGENSGDWHLQLENGKAELLRGNGRDCTLRLDVSTLSRLYIGALKPSVACATGLAECDRPDKLPALDAALALPEPWMFERF
ncbi:MAG TPA: GNAT family N-acetyltransferase [Longimicrobiales bacterium]